MTSASSLLSRRFVLRGLGVSLALPWLDAMTTRAFAAPSKFTAWKASKVQPQPRVICCYIPNGVNILEWVPKDDGPNYTLSPTLEALRDWRDDFTVISGLGHPHSKGGHSGADTWLTGADLQSVPGSDYSNTISADQVIAAGMANRRDSRRWNCPIPPERVRPVTVTRLPSTPAERRFRRKIPPGVCSNGCSSPNRPPTAPRRSSGMPSGSQSSTTSSGKPGNSRKSSASLIRRNLKSTSVPSVKPSSASNG